MSKRSIRRPAAARLATAPAVEMHEEPVAAFSLSTLRGFMIDDLVDLRDGQITQADANTRASLAASIIETVKLEGDAAGAGRYRNEIVL